MPHVPQLQAADSSARLRESRSAVERVIQYASPRLRQWIAGWLDQSNTPRRPDTEMANELLRLSRQHGARYSDFQMVFQKCWSA